MRCPQCAHAESKVIDSRDLEEGASIRRRRECLKCGFRFTTYERAEAAKLFVTKKDGRREEFDRQKVLAGIRKAAEKRPISAETIENLVDEIESKVRGLGLPEVSSKEIGEMVVDKLRTIDPVAYLRFASVYRSYEDIGAFREELDTFYKRESSKKERT